MTNSIRVFFCTFLAVLSLAAQTIVPQPTTFTNLGQMKPGAIPTSLTCLVGPAGSGCVQSIAATTTSGSPHLCAIDLLATGQTVTIQDGQGTPVKWYSTTLGTSMVPAFFEWHAGKDDACRVFPAGIYIQASATGATGRLSFKYNQ